MADIGKLLAAMLFIDTKGEICEYIANFRELSSKFLKTMYTTSLNIPLNTVKTA